MTLCVPLAEPESAAFAGIRAVKRGGGVKRGAVVVVAGPARSSAVAAVAVTRDDGLVLRASGPAEDAAIRAVIAGAFPDNPKTRAEIVRWQYWDNPFGPTRAWVWEDAGQLVAHYTAYSVPVVLGGRATIAGIGVDAAVLPSHQGRGLFTPLSTALYADCGRHGMPITICYPNANSTTGITKAGWRPVARLRTLVRPLDDAWLAARFRLPRLAATVVRASAFGVGATGGLVAEEVGAPPDGLDELWAAVAPTVSHGVVRDAAWWRWRYAGHPDAPYRYFAVRRQRVLLGAAVTLAREAFGGRFLNVLELLTADVAAARALTQAIAAAGRADEAVGAALVAVPGSALDRLAPKAGFRRLPERLEPKPLMFGVVINKMPDETPDETPEETPEETPGQVPGDDPPRDPAAARWSVAWGDLDHI